MRMEDEERLALEAVQAGDYERARGLLLPLAGQGSAYAMNVLGWMHEHRKIKGASKTEGATWFRRAAEGGITEGFYYSGMLLLDCGDRAGAREAFERGIALGSLQAMYGLGRCLEQGETEADQQEALRWLEKAAAGGHFRAKRRLLGIQSRKSLLGRIMFLPRLLRLTIRALALHRKDSNSERLH
jgi:TPR repeat protein